MIGLKFRKCLFIFVLMLIGITLFACEEDNPPQVKVPESLEIYPVEGINIKKMNVGDTFELAVEVTPYDANDEVVWSTSDKRVASISEDGVVKALSGGTFTVTATSKHDDTVVATYKNTITVIDDSEDYARIDEVIGWLEELFPEGYVANGYTEFPTAYEELPQISISWTSSNPTVFPINDAYQRGKEDYTITVTAKVKSGSVQKEFTRDILLESEDKAQLKSLDDHKLVFMYLYTPITGFTKEDIQGIDVINLSFALIDNTSHKLKLSDVNRKYDTVIRAHSYGIRVVLSIGGWGADGFSQACESASTRETFIGSIMDAVKKYNYDGIDLDWEYPTSRSAGIAASTSDKANFTLLCQELRAALDEYKPGLLLTAAVSGSDTKYYDVKALNACLDYWHIMTYEYNRSDTSSYDSDFKRTKEGIDKWVKAGASNVKVVLGITFYASVYKVNSLNGTVPGLGQNAVSSPSHVALSKVYPNIIDNDDFKVGYDSTNGMGYAYSYSRGGDGYFTFASFDVARSLKDKAEFIKSARLAGIMSWELGEDTTDRRQLKLVIEAMNKYAN